MTTDKLYNYYRKLRNSRIGDSPILKIHLGQDISGYDPFPFFIRTPDGRSVRLVGVEFTSEPTGTTPRRIESILLSLVTSTDYATHQNIECIVRGRYTINFNGLPTQLINDLFNYVVFSKKPRISKSWLVPLQDRLISEQSHQLNKSRIANGSEKRRGLRKSEFLLDSFTSQRASKSFSSPISGVNVIKEKLKYSLPISTEDLIAKWVNMSVDSSRPYSISTATAGVSISTTPDPQAGIVKVLDDPQEYDPLYNEDVL